MKIKTTLLTAMIICISYPSFADDSERYAVAKYYKQIIQSAVHSSNSDLKGVCRVMLTMDHIDDSYAKLKRIRTSGNHKLCKIASTELRHYKASKIRYDEPEKLLRLTITASD